MRARDGWMSFGFAGLLGLMGLPGLLGPLGLTGCRGGGEGTGTKADVNAQAGPGAGAKTTAVPVAKAAANPKPGPVAKASTAAGPAAKAAANPKPVLIAKASPAAKAGAPAAKEAGPKPASRAAPEPSKPAVWTPHMAPRAAAMTERARAAVEGLKEALGAGAHLRGKARQAAQQDALRPYLPQQLGVYLAASAARKAPADAKAVRADGVVSASSSGKDLGRLLKVLEAAVGAGPSCVGFRCAGADKRAAYVVRFRPRPDGSLALAVVLRARAGAQGVLTSHEAAAEAAFERQVGEARRAFLDAAGLGAPPGAGAPAGGASGKRSEVALLRAAARVLALRPDEPVVLSALARRAARAKRYGRALEIVGTLVHSPNPDALAAAEELVLGGGDPALAALKTAPGFAKVVREVLATPPTKPGPFAAYLVRFRGSDRRLRRSVGRKEGLPVARCTPGQPVGAAPACKETVVQADEALPGLRLALKGMAGEALMASSGGYAGATWVGPLILPTGQARVLPVPAIRVAPGARGTEPLRVTAIRLPAL